jgi:hypothetical protein
MTGRSSVSNTTRELRHYKAQRDGLAIMMRIDGSLDLVHARLEEARADSDFLQAKARYDKEWNVCAKAQPLPALFKAADKRRLSLLRAEVAAAYVYATMVKTLLGAMQ